MTDRRILEEIEKIKLAERPRPGTGNLAGAKKFRLLHISLPPDLLDTLARSGINKSQTIERLLRFYFKLLDTDS